MEHAKAYGRIAFSCPFEEQPKIDEKIRAKNHAILTPLISLDTPGKATVQVIILADPVRVDSILGHCMVEWVLTYEFVQLRYYKDGTMNWSCMLTSVKALGSA